MTTKNQEILKVLKSAMEAELIGHQFYKNVDQNTSDEQGKQVFQEMAAEEMKCSISNYPRRQYQSIIDAGSYNFSTKLMMHS